MKKASGKEVAASVDNKSIATNTPIAESRSRAAKSIESVFDDSFDAAPQSLNIYTTPKSNVHGPIWDFDKGVSSLDCAKAGTISYREKRNPLSSTRLSCYKPKISDNYSLPHYKSVDDFLFLNGDHSDDIASNSSSNSEYSGENRTVLPDINANCQSTENRENIFVSRQPKSSESDSIRQQENEASRGNRKEFDETYGFTAISAKSVENILEPKLYALASNTKRTRKDSNMANFSEKIKCMSSRTQKLFSKIYNNTTSSNSKQSKQSVKPNNEQEFIDVIAGIHNVPKSRRSLSYGNLPELEDFHQTLQNVHDSTLNSKGMIDEEKISETMPQEYIKHSTNAAFSHQNVKDDLTVGGEDTDSGILVNESGQSSIIDSDYVYNNEHIMIGASELGNRTHRKNVANINPDAQFKFLTLSIEEGDQERCLGFGVKATFSDTNCKNVGYQVATITSGGLVDR